MPGLFFCLLARETSLFFERRPFFSSEGPPLFRAVRTKTFSAHNSSFLRSDVRKKTFYHARQFHDALHGDALLVFDIYPVEVLEPSEPASPFAWGVAVGIA